MTSVIIRYSKLIELNKGLAYSRGPRVWLVRAVAGAMTATVADRSVGTAAQGSHDNSCFGRVIARVELTCKHLVTRIRSISIINFFPRDLRP